MVKRGPHSRPQASEGRSATIDLLRDCLSRSEVPGRHPRNITAGWCESVQHVVWTILVVCHCCPAIFPRAYRKLLIENTKADFRGVTDLNVDLRNWGFSASGFLNVHRQTGFRPAYGFSAAAHVPAMRCAISVELSNQNLFASGSVFVHGVCATDVSKSLRDIEVCLRAQESKLYHLGIRGHVARSNLADANEKRDWRIYRDFANALIVEARRLYAEDAFGVDLDNTVYALDTTTIDLSLKVFPWAHFRKKRRARSRPFSSIAVPPSQTRALPAEARS